jgi:hypothetical protein
MRYFKIAICTLLLLLCALLASCKQDACAEGHTFEEWKIKKQPTCAAEGEREAICTVCGAPGKEAIPATGAHRADEFAVEKPATLFERGLRTQYCKRCEQLLAQKEIPAICESIAVDRSTQRVTLDLSDCAVVYDASAHDAAYLASVRALGDALTRYTGKTVPVRPYSDTDDSGATCEIVISCRELPEVQEAQLQLSGNGFLIKESAGRVVILGTNDLQTMRAVQYFADVCVPATGNGAALEISASMQARNTVQSVIGTQGSFLPELVYSRELDNDPAHKHVSSSTSDSRDYPCVAAENLAKELAAIFEVKPGALCVRTDHTYTPYELLIGSFPDRPEVEAFRSTLDGHEYGILVHDGQVILTAHNDVALGECIAHFKQLLLSAEYTDQNGKRTYAFPEGFCIRVPLENDWVTDFPRPTGEGIKLHNTQYNNDNSLQYYYTGAGVNADTYRNYCDQLLAAGYRLLCENSIEGSLFKTFVNDAAGTTLYVAYNDYKYEADYVKNDEFHTDFEKCIRVITAPLGSVTLPDAGLLTPEPTYGKVADSTITQMPYTGKAVGMGYVIRLEDGRFIVIDGGGVVGSEADMIWNVLSELYRDAYGTEPTSLAPVVIAAWINTHSHWDHYYAFQRMLKDYGKTGLLRMEYMLGNFPEASAIYAVTGSTLQMGKPTTIPTMQGNVTGGFKYVKVHTGQKFYLANAELEILMTYEDHNPRRICNSNDTCTIVRFTFTNKDAAAGAAPTTAIFLADAFRFQSRYLCAMYGSYLRSDIVQLAHHGNIGCEKEVYEAISATTVLFPHNYGSFSNYTAGKSSTWNFKVDYFVVKQQQSVRYVFVAEKLCLTFALRPQGADFENIYDIANKKAPIAFDGRTAIKKQ